MGTGRMRTGLGAAFGAGMLVLGLALPASAQPPGAVRPGAQVLVSSAAPAPVQAAVEVPPDGEIVREIRDPNLGDRWLLMRNSEVPGGPGRLVLVAAHRGALGAAAVRVAHERDGREETRLLSVIRAGDRLRVEEHTAHVDAGLEARALGPAAAGSALDARLTIGGRVVRAVALGPGRAALQPETEARP